MKRVWIAVFVAVLAVPALAAAQDRMGDHMGWCAGASNAQGTNFGTCPNAGRDVQVAGQASGIRRQTQTMASDFGAVVDYSAQIESPGTGD
jgi:hypothetical protein